MLNNIKTKIKELYKINSYIQYNNPIEKQIHLNYIFNRQGHFHPQYIEWTVKRINKILELYDIDDLKGKKILVLGDGIGNIGGFLAAIGANVLALEYRQFNINIAKLKFKEYKNYKIQQFDLNKDFTRFGKFDMIINFGFLEVINNIDNVLRCCAKMTNVILLETLVADNSKIAFITKTKLGDTNDAGVIGEVTRVSEKYIEDYFSDAKFTCTKHLDKNLNTDFQSYTWTNKNDNSVNEHHRRFWVIKND